MRGRAGASLVFLVVLAARAGAQDFSGTWAVSGTDPRGAFGGTAVVKPVAGGYAVERLVTYQQKLASGRELVVAWNARARNEAGGLRVEATLKRADVVRRAGAVTRTAADRAPLAVSGLLSGSGAVVTLGTKVSGALNGGQETWTRAAMPVPAFPATDRKLVATHKAPSGLLKWILFQVFSGFHKLPEVKPYTGRADFKAAVHKLPVDRTAKAFLRARGPGVVVLLDKVVDAVSIAEESRRADAFTRSLAEKARLYDADMKNVHAPVHGMPCMVENGKREAPVSVALYSGIWALSQYHRFKATGDGEALANLELATRGLALCVEVPPDKKEFARGIDLLSNAPPSFPAATGKYSWARGQGAHANLIWMRGGNNDMLHGIDLGFVAAEAALPPGHPLRAEIAKQAVSLLENSDVAKKTSHEQALGWVAWRTTGQTKWRDRYKKSLGWKSIVNKLYLRFGNGLLHWQGFSDWSGQQLNALTFHKVGFYGAANPDPDARSWRDAARDGIRRGFANMGLCRNGLVSATAAPAGAAGAAEQTRELLGEFPYPKTQGDVEIDPSISDEFSLSPYPTLPWKLDWTRNPERRMALVGTPLFFRGSDENYWSRGPFSLGRGASDVVPPGQDYLVAYWFARANGVIGPTE